MEAAQKIANLIIKTFTGKSIAQIEEETLRGRAVTRLMEAHLLAKKQGVNIPMGNFTITESLSKEPAFYNYLHQLGYADAVHEFPRQLSESHYSLGYKEGQLDRGGK